MEANPGGGDGEKIKRHQPKKLIQKLGIKKQTEVKGSRREGRNGKAKRKLKEEKNIRGLKLIHDAGRHGRPGRGEGKKWKGRSIWRKLKKMKKTKRERGSGGS